MTRALCGTDARLTSALARAERERERHRDLFDATPLAYVVTDHVGVIQDANAAAERLIGVGVRRMRGRPIAALTDPLGAARLRDLVAEIPTLKTADLELRLRRPRGTPFWASVSCAMMERGRRVLWVIRDISEERAKSEELAEANGALRATVTERTAQLERSLRDVEDLLARERELRARLQRSDQAKDRFIAILSHDLRGPIHCVLGWIDVLRRETMGKEARDRALATIERSTRSQLALVEELLDFSRITADRMSLELEPVDLASVVRRVVETFTRTATQNGVELEIAVETERGTAAVFADRHRIEQIMSSLVGNALRFTPAGGRVRVRIARDRGQVLAEVTDSGVGLAADAIGDLFECWKRGSVKTPTARAGLGLSLYIASQLAHLHGGTIEATSAGPGQGAAFTLRLPLRDLSMNVASEIALPEDRPDLAGMRVLVVDDEDDVRELMTAVLADQGADVSAAPDAATAVAMFDSCPPDVVVSDIGMPGEDGCALIRRLRTRSGEVLAIAVSGLIATKDAERALSAGFDVHVRKPIEAAHLVSTIRELTARDAR